MKKFRIVSLIMCFMLLGQLFHGLAFAEETTKEIIKDGEIITEEEKPSADKTEDGEITDEGVVDGGGSGIDNLPAVTEKTQFNGHTYQVVLTAKALTWEAARAAAEKEGGHLATVTSREEQDFLMTITGGALLWLGGYRDDSYNWYWVTGEEWDYTNWAEGEPNDSSNVVKDEKYIALWPEQWNDLANGNVYEQNGYVIEWDDEEIEDPEDPEDPENPDDPGKDNGGNKKKKKKPNPPKQITIQRAKGIIKGYCKKNLRVFAMIKNKKYKTVANKKGRFKFNVPKIKVAVVRLYCKSKEGVKSNVVKARCNSMISKKDKK